jgi:glycosyltransferase involved in cell wall biosynthesis
MRCPVHNRAMLLCSGGNSAWPTALFFWGSSETFKQWKGQHVAIEAIRILRDAGVKVACFVIGGVSHLKEDKEYFARLKKMVADYGLDDRVFFTGFRNEIPALISELDLILHTSIQPEPFGRVILEGMLSAKPVIDL